MEVKIIPDCKKTYAEMPDKFKNITAEINKTEQMTEMLRKNWHQEVDNIFNKLASLFAATKNRNSETLKTQQNTMKTCIQSMTQTLQRNKDILKSNNASDFTGYKSELSSYRGIDTDIDFTQLCLKANALQGKNLSMEVGNTKATLTFTSLSSPFAKTSDAIDRIKLHGVWRVPFMPDYEPLSTRLNRFTNESRLSIDGLERLPRSQHTQGNSETDKK